jgi:hypothetical protein
VSAAIAYLKTVITLRANLLAAKIAELFDAAQGDRRKEKPPQKCFEIPAGLKLTCRDLLNYFSGDFKANIEN